MKKLLILIITLFSFTLSGQNYQEFPFHLKVLGNLWADSTVIMKELPVLGGDTLLVMRNDSIGYILSAASGYWTLNTHTLYPIGNDDTIGSSTYTIPKMYVKYLSGSDPNNWLILNNGTWMSSDSLTWIGGDDIDLYAINAGGNGSFLRLMGQKELMYIATKHGIDAPDTSISCNKSRVKILKDLYSQKFNDDGTNITLHGNALLIENLTNKDGDTSLIISNDSVYMQYSGFKAWTPTLTWGGDAPGGITTVARYRRDNDNIEYMIDIQGTMNAGHTATSLTITLPVDPADVNMYIPASTLVGLDIAGGGKMSPAVAGMLVDASDNTPANRKLLSGYWTNWAASTSNRIIIRGFYEFKN